MKPKVKRLPVQHRNHPHCESCDRPLPTFDFTDLTISLVDMGGTALQGVTFHIRCACGEPWDLRKEVKK
jgi:hypothetical protein